MECISGFSEVAFLHFCVYCFLRVWMLFLHIHRPVDMCTVYIPKGNFSITRFMPPAAVKRKGSFSGVPAQTLAKDFVLCTPVD